MSDRYGPRFLICGSRTWGEALPIFDRIAALPYDAEVIVGDARGADRMASREAVERNLVVTQYPADWRKHGKRAGIVRNLQMLDARPDLVIAFWDGKSNGTKHTIDEARRRGIPVELVRPTRASEETDASE